MSNKKDSINTMQRIAKLNGGYCLSPVYNGSKTLLTWKCKNGHVWQNTPTHIKQGQWCRECAGLKRKTIEQMRILAELKGGTCISSNYKNSETKLEWKCSKGHIWMSRPDSIKGGTWCPYCSNRFPLSLSDLQRIAITKGGKLLSKTYVNSHSKLQWQCSKRHVWKSTPYSIKSGTWCPICSGNVIKSTSDLEGLAISRGGKCLSKTYVNVDTKYVWECSLGHRFINSFNKVSHGQWCPICSKSSISEEICRMTFQEIFRTEFIKTRPKWLKNSRGYQMEIDGYSKKENIGFEYQGRQHFEKIGVYIKTDKMLSQRKMDDKLKENLCKEHGIKLFIITYKMNYWDFPNEIFNQATGLGIDTSKFAFDMNINLNKAYIRKDRLNELTSILNLSKIDLLSEKWLGVKGKYKVKCQIDGNVWEASGSELIRGSGCMICSRRNNSNKQRGSINDLKEYAKIHGGIVLSTIYTNARSKYQFRCLNGHIFSVRFNNLKFRNQFCPACEGRTARVINNSL